MIFPVIQRQFSVIEIAELKGYMPEVDTPSFSDSTWFDGTFQKSAETFLKRNIGFHSGLVRVNNQIQFSLFDKIRASGIIKGKGGHYFAPQYIRSYYGVDYIGSSKIKEKVRKLSLITEKLESKGISLIVVIVPGKGMFYPEYIPDAYKRNSFNTSNYQAYIEAFKDSKINCIDIVTYYLSLKDTSSYELFPKSAIHSSLYGNYFIADKLIKYIEEVHQLKVPFMEIESIEVQNKPKDPDKDIELAMNLIFPFKEEGIAYADLGWDMSRADPSLSVLTIGDSFYWMLLSFGYTAAFLDHEFWYYNHYERPIRNGKNADLGKRNLKDEIESKDVIMIYVNDAQLKDLGWGFIENVYDIYFEN